MPTVRYNLTADPSGFQKGFAAAEGQAKKFADSLVDKGGAAGKVLSALGPVGVAAAAGIGVATVATAAVGAALVSAAQQAITLGSTINDMSAKTGIAAESLQKLKYAASLAGVDLAGVTASVGKMQVAINSSSAAIGKLGLDLGSLKKLSPEEQFVKIGNAINNLKTAAERTAASREIFGKAGADNLALFASGMETAIGRAKELGLVMSAETVAGLDATGDAADTLKQTWEGLWTNIGAAIATAPGVASALDALAGAIGNLSTWVQDNSSVLQSWVTDLLVPMADIAVAAAEGVMYLASAFQTVGSAVSEAYGSLSRFVSMLPGLKFDSGGMFGNWGLGAGNLYDTFIKGASGLGADRSGSSGSWGGKTGPDYSQESEAAKKAAAEMEKAWGELADKLAAQMKKSEDVAREWEAAVGEKLKSLTGLTEAQDTELTQWGMAWDDVKNKTELSGEALQGFIAKLQTLKKAGGPETIRQLDEAMAELGARVASMPPLKIGGGGTSGLFGMGGKPGTSDPGFFKAESLDKWSEKMAGLATIGQAAGQVLEALGVKGESALGKIVRGFTIAAQAAAGFLKAMATGDVFGMVASGLGFLGGIFGLFGGGKKKREEEERKRKEAEDEARRERERIQGLARESRAAGVEGISQFGPAFFAQRNILNPQDAERQGAIFAAAWGAVVKDKGLAAAAELFGGTIKKMTEDMSAAGIEIPSWLKDVGSLSEIGLDEEFRNIAESASTAAKLLKALGESGVLGPELISAFQDEARNAFAAAQQRARDMGKTEDEAMKAGFAVANPLLKELANQAILQNQTLDPDIQALIDQAGIVPDVQYQQLDELRAIRDAVRSLAGFSTTTGGGPGGVGPGPGEPGGGPPGGGGFNPPGYNPPGGGYGGGGEGFSGYSFGGGGGGGGERTIVIPLTIDGREVARATARVLDRRTDRSIDTAIAKVAQRTKK